MDPQKPELLRKRIKILISFFIIALVLSGITALPLEWELGWLNSLLHRSSLADTELAAFISTVNNGLIETNNNYPFIAYGTDWLAFAHIIIAIAFIGPLKDPVKNIWIIQFGLIACLLIIPFALIAGEIREIPFYWRVIDCSFGIFGLIPLFICLRQIKELQLLESTINPQVYPVVHSDLHDSKIFDF